MPSRAGWKARMRSADELIVTTTPAQHDLPGLLERPDDLYDGGLGLLHGRKPLRPKEVDLLDQVVAGALRDVRQHLVLHGAGDALERDRQYGGVDLAQDQLHTLVLERGDVVEDEEPAAD